MDQGILSQAQSIYMLAKKAGLVIGGSLGDLFPEAKLLEIRQSVGADKDNFLESNTETPNADVLWRGGENKSISDRLVKHLVLYCVDHQKGMMLDWKFSAEDVVFNVKSLLPGFDIQSLGEKQVSGDWFEVIKIEGEEYSFIQENAMVYEVIKPINSHLEKKGLAFITPTNSDDNIYLLLVALETVAEFEELGFYLA